MLSDNIEKFIKALLQEDGDHVELKRNELAEHFSCAPSQINYVLATRFTVDHGYLIESRRGGGGYVRVLRLKSHPDDYLSQLVTSRIGNNLSYQEARRILERICQKGLIGPRELTIMSAALEDKAIMLPASLKDTVRAGLFRAMVVAIMRG